LARILFVHRHGPGQFVHLARHLAAKGSEVTLLCEKADRPIADVRIERHRAVPFRASEGATSADYQLRVGAEVAAALTRLRRTRGDPDIIIGHGGWGSLLFVKDVFPSTPVLGYCEFFYQAHGADIGFDPKNRPDFTVVRRLKSRNFAQTSTLLAIEAGISPTRWQRSLFPEDLRGKIGVVHDGIDTSFCRPDPNAVFVLPGGRVLRAGEKIVTFAARDLEPYRGFPQFMRAAAHLAREDPAIVFLVAGGDGVSYGKPHESGRPWREVMMDETGIDAARIHFLGTLPHAALIRMFQVSAAHVYLTYPFVLSWSMLEAMACGALLIASATAPVEEFVEHGNNGLLTPFFDVDALCSGIKQALGHNSAAQLRTAARRTVLERAELEACLQRQVGTLRALAA
jgi:glycosyltransferase involved in cell wall biosynthesis